jgi:NAD(P)-dependent dehydrogenase (short-subunit alcohol dehydrogenase family)
MLVVTGAAGTLGRTVMNLAKSRGFKVLGVDLTNVSEAGFAHGDYIGEIDLTRDDQLACLAETIDKSGNSVSSLVNIAGGFLWEKVEDASGSDWADMMRINFNTALNATRTLLPYFGDQGAIVNIGAAAAQRATAGMGPYTVAKSAVARLTETLSEELKSRSIRVNMVSPTIIDTPRNRVEMPHADRSNWVSPDAVAECILFLVSASSRGVNGENIRLG